MQNPKHQRYAERLSELVEEGKRVAALERPSDVGPFIQGEDTIQLHDWMTKVRNILETVFGCQSPHFQQYSSLLPKEGMGDFLHSYDVYPVVGVLKGALKDLDGGFLAGQELIIAGEVLDSIVGQSRQLLQGGFKDPAAVLGRVVLEDALKRIARSLDVEDGLKASAINDELKKVGKYSQPQWRFVQAWLDIGNAAAHGKFDEYSEKDVSDLIDGVERFLATELR